MNETPKTGVPAPLTRTVELVTVLGGVAVLFLAVLVFCDVVGRFFGAPIFGARDIMTVTLVVIVASGFAYGAIHGAHIAIDALRTVLPPRWRAAQLVIADLLSLAVLGILCWRCFVSGLEASSFGEMTMLISIPYAPFYFALSAGFGLFALVRLFQLASHPKRGEPK